MLLAQACSQGGLGEGVRSNPPFDHIHAYYTSIHTCIYLYEYTFIPSEPGSQFCRDCIALLKFYNNALGYRTSPVLPLGTHFFRKFSVVNLVDVAK